VVEGVRQTPGTTDRRSLAGVSLLRDLDGEERAALERQCVWRRYRLGERVFERGSDGRDVFFVVEGTVNIVGFSATGREITFATAQAGDTVGELAAIDEQPRSASVVASADSLLAVLPAEPFVELLRRHGEITFKLLRRLSTIVRRGDARVVELSSLQATQRVYAELLRLAKPDAAAPDLWTIKPLPTLRDLASQASTTRELVASALSQLYPSGLIRRKGDALYIIDRAALEEIVSAAREADR
jgi:CRP/FNR family transcriptional regulator, cyclic AMP receptor protein